MEFPTEPGLVWPSPRTFFGAPRCDDLAELAADVAFLGVPYDAGTLQPYIRTGQSGGPALARAASFNQLDYAWPSAPRPEGGSLGWFDIESGRDHLVGVTMADCGDVGITGAQIDENLERITEASRTIAERSLVVAVGGDHSISFPVGRGMERFAPIDVVHFDAHADFVDHFFGARFSHGSQLRRLSELPFVRSITAIGLRNVFRAEYEDLRSYGAGIATSLEVMDDGPAGVIERLVPEGGNLYVSIDIDVLDLPIVPGTTLPEPGGLSYRDLRSLLHHTAQRGRVVGFDIVELDAPHDVSGATSRVTTWLIVHFLSSIFEAR